MKEAEARKEHGGTYGKKINSKRGGGTDRMLCAVRKDQNAAGNLGFR